MKYFWICLVILALSLGVVGCIRSRGNSPTEDEIEREDMPGGLRDLSNKDAPKTIVSTEILSFDLEFNCDCFAYYGSPATDGVCRLSLVREDDGARFVVSGSIDAEFVTGYTALGELQAIIEEYNLAKYNGVDRFVYGLPTYYGDSLLVKYASGESIYAADNQTPIIQDEARFAFFYFFGDLAEAADCGFYSEKYEAFQYRKRGRWVDYSGRYTLELYDDKIKLYDKDKLTDDSTYRYKTGTRYDGRTSLTGGQLANTKTEDGSYNLFCWLEWDGDWLNGRGEDGAWHQFKRVDPDPSGS